MGARVGAGGSFRSAGGFEPFGGGLAVHPQGTAMPLALCAGKGRDPFVRKGSSWVLAPVPAAGIDGGWAAPPCPKKSLFFPCPPPTLPKHPRCRGGDSLGNSCA